MNGINKKIDMDYNVKHPAYYEGKRKITPWDVIDDWHLDYYMGNVVKYIGRFFRKPDIELTPEQKAVQDIDKMIEHLKKERDLITSDPNYVPYEGTKC